MCVFVTIGFKCCQALQLLLAHFRVINLQYIDWRFSCLLQAVNPDDSLLGAIDTGLGTGRGFFNTQFGNTCFNRLGHAAL